MIAGVNIGGTTTSVIFGDAGGTIRQRRAWPTQAHDGEALIASVLDALRAFPTVASIGVAVGGPMDARRGVVVAPPHLPGLHGVDVRARLSAFGVPVRVHHDAAACALAEWRWGAHAGVAGLAYLTSGTGFGCGLVLDGRVRYGSAGASPELGHVRYRDDGPDVFGKPGCFESYGAASALPKLARRIDARFTPPTGAAVARAAADGDATALRAIDDNADAVGAACALLADLLVLDAIVLGSLATYLGDAWIGRVRERFEAEVLPDRRACALTAPTVDAVQDRSALAAALDVPAS